MRRSVLPLAAALLACNQEIPNTIYPLSAWGYTLGDAAVDGLGNPQNAYLLQIATTPKPGAETDIRWLGMRSRCQYGDTFKDAPEFVWLARNAGHVQADTGTFDDMKTLPDACELTFALSNSGGDFPGYDPKGDGVYCVLKGKFTPGACPEGAIRPK